MAVEKIQVIGAGQMGSGIAQVAVQAGLAVHLADVDEAALEKGFDAIQKNLTRSVERGHVSQQEMDEALARIERGTDYAADADLAIEAVVELVEVKAEVLHKGFGDSKYRPCPLLRRYVAARRLGRKSGWGFYDYT